MATKNVSRTVREKGCDTAYSAVKNQIDRRRRSSERSYFADVKKSSIEDLDDLDDLDPFAETERLYGRYSYPRLQPVYRWLNAQVGRLWLVVEAELRARYGKDRAIMEDLFPHRILNHVDPHAHHASYRYTWFIDESGVMQRVPLRKQHRHFVKRITKDLAAKIDAWLAGRGIIQRGERFYWGLHDQSLRLTWSTSGSKNSKFVSTYGLRYVTANSTEGNAEVDSGYYNHLYANHYYAHTMVRLRQGREFTKEELSFLRDTVPSHMYKTLITVAE